MANKVSLNSYTNTGDLHIGCEGMMLTNSLASGCSPTQSQTWTTAPQGCHQTTLGEDEESMKQIILFSNENKCSFQEDADRAIQ